MDELRRKGLEKMNEVYGWEMPDMPGEYFALTVDHLFGTIWTRPGLSMRDKRMMTLTVLTALGRRSCWRSRPTRPVQRGADREELKEMAIFLTHYLGFPLGSKLDGVVTEWSPSARRLRRKGRARTRRTTSTPPCRCTSGSNLDDK